ncbi:aminoacyltransferase [Staphylococcus americanisciuri]|uniref:Aminoacyltransferase FemA n=1 Tax=Staphylococcus americanisciuri TaxID=2973940 RepID=A0ABT2F3W8_9STAP|nr:aminoacyltransferase [Staphylococcus americanisciuri]MCS4487097.1 aminoacyltransferase [Staphylococcus americanisciuri]
MQFTELTEQEYRNFIKQHFRQFSQSIEHYRYRHKHGKTVYLLGVKDHSGEVIAAGLFTAAPIMRFFNYVYSHRGPVMDYNNATLVKYFFESLTRYLRWRRCIFALIDPYIPLNERDHNGHIIVQHDQQSLLSQLTKLGYQYQGLTTGYSDLSQGRWLSVLPLKGKTEQDLLKAMDYNTARSIKKSRDMGVQVRDLTRDELATFHALYKMAEEKHGFSTFSPDYIEQFLDMYPTKSMMKLAYLDLDEHMANLQIELKQAEHRRTTLQQAVDEAPKSKKRRNVLKEQEIICESLKKRYSEAQALQAEHGNILHLAGAIFVENEHELVYMYSGSNPAFNRYMGNYTLQWEMIRYALEQGHTRYNFYGVTGVFSRDAEDYGVLDFKKGFGGYIEELVGDFIKPIHPLLYRLYNIKHRR